MSGLEVVGGISSVIGMIDTSIKTYNNGCKDLEVSEAFDTVGRRLPVILDTLRTCKNYLEPNLDSIPSDACEALDNIVDACRRKAKRLKDIFKEVMSGDDDERTNRYLKVMQIQVEQLMLSITEDVQLVVNHYAVRSAAPDQLDELERIVKEMKSVQPSELENEGQGTRFYSGGGTQTSNLNTGSGQQIINSGGEISDQNNGTIHHNYNRSGKQRPRGWSDSKVWIWP